MRYLKGIILIILIAVAAWAQNRSGAMILGVRPNLVLVILIIAAALIDNLSFFIVLLMAGAAVLQNAFIFSWPTVVFLLIGFIAFFLTHRLPWQTAINIFFSIGVLVIVFYALIDLPFVVENILIVFQELFFDLLIGAVLYGLTSLFPQKLQNRYLSNP